MKPFLCPAANEPTPPSWQLALAALASPRRSRHSLCGAAAFFSRTFSFGPSCPALLRRPTCDCGIANGTAAPSGAGRFHLEGRVRRPGGVLQRLRRLLQAGAEQARRQGAIPRLHLHHPSRHAGTQVQNLSLLTCGVEVGVLRASLKHAVLETMVTRVLRCGAGWRVHEGNDWHGWRTAGGEHRVSAWLRSRPRVAVQHPLMLAAHKLM